MNTESQSSSICPYRPITIDRFAISQLTGLQGLFQALLNFHLEIGFSWLVQGLHNNPIVMKQQPIQTHSQTRPSLAFFSVIGLHFSTSAALRLFQVNLSRNMLSYHMWISFFILKLYEACTSRGGSYCVRKWRQIVRRTRHFTNRGLQSRWIVVYIYFGQCQCHWNVQRNVQAFFVRNKPIPKSMIAWTQDAIKADKHSCHPSMGPKACTTISMAQVGSSMACYHL